MGIRIHYPWFLVYLLYTGALLWGSLDSDPSLPDLGVLTWDKFLHAVAYGGLTVLGGLAIRGTRSSAYPWILSASIALGLGGLLEIAQSILTRRRIGDWNDLLADAIGIFLALSLVLLSTVFRNLHQGSR